MSNEMRSNNGHERRRSINDLPDEIVRLILEYVNTCEREDYITLSDVMYELYRFWTTPRSAASVGMSVVFDLSDEDPPDLALLDARRVCKRWYDISETIIYRRVVGASATKLRPVVGNRIMSWFLEHIHQRRQGASCYGQTHVVDMGTVRDLHCIVAHHRESKRTRMRFLRNSTCPSADQGPGLTSKYLWDGCDCSYSQSAAMNTGNDFLIAMLTADEVERATQLVWGGSFARTDSEMLDRCVRALDMAREALKLSQLDAR